MRKMFTRLFGLMLLMYLVSSVTLVRAQFAQTSCGPTIQSSNIKLVTPIADVCDSSELITFKVVGYPGAELYVNGSTTPSSDSTFSVKEGITVVIQLVEDDTCVSNLLAVETDVVEPIVIEASDVESPKCGDDMGEVTIKFSGGYTGDYGMPADPYRYQIVPMDTFATYGPMYYADYVSLSPNIAKGPGTYVVAAYDNKPVGSVCLADLYSYAAWDTAVVEPTSPAVVIDTIFGDDPVCFEGTTMITVDVSGGTPASYGLIVDLWDASSNTVVATDSVLLPDTTAIFTDIAEGTYYATVVDSFGCDDQSDDLEITAPDEPVFDIAIQSVDCFGGSNGEITAFILSDTANEYEALIVSLDTSVDNMVYPWTSMGSNDSVTFTGLDPIYYALFVRDVTNGCDSVPYENPNNSLNYISLQSPGEIAMNLTYSDSIVCPGDSTDLVINSITGGSGEFTAVLVEGYSGPVVTPTVVGESWRVPMGTYTLTITDTEAGSCDVDSTIVINGNYPVAIDEVYTSNPICPGDDDGTIEIIAINGTGVYEYSIDGENWYADNVFNGSAGEYTVYVRDLGCEESWDSESATIDEDANTLMFWNPPAWGSDTLICKGTSTGGIGISSFGWNRSGSGLEWTRNIKAYYTTDVTSVYDAEASVEMEKHWDDYWTAENLPAGTYYIWAIDTFGCKFDADIDGTPDYLTVNIREYEPLDLAVDVISDASCYEANDGLVTLTKAGGNSEVDQFYYGIAKSEVNAYLKDVGSLTMWPAGDDDVNMNVTGGTHYFILYDAGCDERIVVEKVIAGWEEVTIEGTIDVDHIVCYGAAAGTITIPQAKGGSGDLVYTLYKEEDKKSAKDVIEIDTVEGYVGVPVTDTVFSGLYAGDYYIEVTDTGADSCDGYWTETITIEQPELYFTIKESDITCYGNADGTVELRIEGAGATAPYFKLGASSWQPFENKIGTIDPVWTKTVDILEPGDYVVYAIDAAGKDAGCDGMAIPFSIIEPPVLTVSAMGYDTTACSTSDDGYIVVSVDGGKAIVDSFMVEVDDVEHLIARDSVLVIEGLAPATYEVTVTEVDMAVTSPCVMTMDVEVKAPGELVAAIEYTEMLTCKGDSTGIIELDITGGSGTYFVEINGVSVTLNGDDQIIDLPAGKYAIDIVDDGECEFTDTVVIAESAEYITLDATKIQDITCQDSGMFSIQATGGVAPYTYYAGLSEFPDHMLLPDDESAEWQSDSIFTVGDEGTWVVWVKDSLGCIVGGEFDKDDNEINKWRVPIAGPDVDVTVTAAVTEAKCSADEAMVVISSDSIIVTDKGLEVTRAYTTWFENLAGDTLAVGDTLLIQGDTTVVAWVKDTQSGCTGSDVVILSQPTELSADTLIVAEGEFSCPDITEGYMEVMVSGGTAPYEYKIIQNGVIKTPNYTSNNSFLAQVNNTYSFIVKDANDCTDTLDVPVLIESVDSVKIVDIMDISCADDTLRGSALVTITGEPGRTFDIHWRQFENGGVPADEGVMEDVMAGDVALYQKFLYDNENVNDIHYEIWVVDNMGCVSLPDTLTIDHKVTSELAATVTVGDVVDCSTEVMVSANGGVAPYMVVVNEMDTTWFESSTTLMLGGGEQTIDVYDAHLCWKGFVETLDYAYSMDTTFYVYPGDSAELVYAPADIDTMLAADTYYLYYELEEGCIAEIVVNVIESEGPKLESKDPLSRIGDNHPTFTMVFEEAVKLSETGGYLTVTDLDSTEPVLVIQLTEDMFHGDSVIVDYIATDDSWLNIKTKYDVHVDSAAIVGAEDNFPWEGIGNRAWVFSTGPNWATDIDNKGLNATSYVVYPNPFNDEINITNIDKLTRVIVTNIAGQRVLDVEYPEERIRTTNLVSGVYFVSMFTDSGLAKTDKIVKR